jgi:hypothetical protein
VIISALHGGLGNQMFQCAIAIAIAEKSGDEFRVDTRKIASGLVHHGIVAPRVFGFSNRIVGEADIREVLGWRGKSFILERLTRRSLEFLRGETYFSEKQFNFDENALKVTRNKYLFGYWQTEKYFSWCSQSVRSWFSFVDPFSQEDRKISNLISDSVSVSVHVRRGDYISDQGARKVFATCTPRYYRDAFEIIDMKVNRPTFFIFSDDIDWARKNVRVNAPHVFVSHNRGNDSFRDLRLMSLCDHHVIANSSFSWWGAWLAEKSDTIVVAPRMWVTDKKWDNRDRIPTRWFVI